MKIEESIAYLTPDEQGILGLEEPAVEVDELEEADTLHLGDLIELRHRALTGLNTEPSAANPEQVKAAEKQDARFTIEKVVASNIVSRLKHYKQYGPY